MQPWPLLVGDDNAGPSIVANIPSSHRGNHVITVASCYRTSTALPGGKRLSVHSTYEYSYSYS
eukprot:scaffold101654_cov24-Prasinocladus_malaysianus.AAC.2